MKSLTLFILLFGALGSLAALPDTAPVDDLMMLSSPSVDRLHHVQRRVMEEDEDPFIGDPIIRFFLRALISPFSIFKPERKPLHHASKLLGNSTSQKTPWSENVKKLNETEKSETTFGKMESKPKRSKELMSAQRKHFPRFDPFPYIFHRPSAERTGRMMDTEMGEVASTEKHIIKRGAPKTTGSMAHGKNITNITFFNRHYAFIWSIEWRSLLMHIIVVLMIALIITLALAFCQTVFRMDTKKVKLHPEKASLAKDEKFIMKEEAKNMC